MAGAYENPDGSPKYGERVTESKYLGAYSPDELWEIAIAASEENGYGFILISEEGGDARIRSNVKASDVPRVMKMAARELRRAGRKF